MTFIFMPVKESVNDICLVQYFKITKGFLRKNPSLISFFLFLKISYQHQGIYPLVNLQGTELPLQIPC